MVTVGAASYSLLKTITCISDSLTISMWLLFIKTDSKHGTRVINEFTGLRRFAEEKTCMQLRSKRPKLKDDRRNKGYNLQGIAFLLRVRNANIAMKSIWYCSTS